MSEILSRRTFSPDGDSILSTSKVPELCQYHLASLRSELTNSHLRLYIHIEVRTLELGRVGTEYGRQKMFLPSWFVWHIVKNDESGKGREME